MRIGSLNRWIEIVRRESGRDPAGQPFENWTVVAGVWANIRNRTGSESIRADRDTSVVQSSIRIRRRSDITAAMRIHYSAKVYEIKAVLDDDESRERLDLVCQLVGD